MAFIEKRAYKYVSPYTYDSTDYVIPNGQILILKEMGGDGINDPNVICRVCWDPTGTPETLFTTIGSHSVSTGVEKTGDGSTILRICLSNQTATSHHMGAYWIGDI